MNLSQKLSDDGMVIFLFHGVIEKDTYRVRNCTKKHLEKEYFYQLIKEIKHTGYPLSMDDVVFYRNSGEPFPPKAFAVTFDDGFANNYTVAAPILEGLKVPATFYVTTDFIDRNRMSWIDRIEYCFETADKGRLNFTWTEKAFFFHSTTDKIHILDYLRNKVKHDSSINLDELVSNIFSQCNMPLIEQSDDPLDMKMNWAQVKDIHEDSLFTVGGHTHRHSILSFLDRTELEREIQISMNLLKQKAGIHTHHYSYPEGMREHYSNEVIKMLKKYGVVCCPTAEYGVNKIIDDLFRLKRVMVT